STPGDPSNGVLQGLRSIADSLGMEPGQFAGQVTTIVHGTTVTTNATLVRGGAKTALLTTEGVRDALEMRRGIRERQYDNRFENVPPLVPRYLRVGVKGRLDHAGQVVEPLDLDDVREAAQHFASEDVEAVAVCFMNAFANPEHEAQAAQILAEHLPDAYLSVSSEVLPTVRFYNRVSTTALNSYVGPILRSYVESLTEKLASLGFGGTLLIMQSNGGVALPSVILERPATTLLSGPAGGPGGAAAYAGEDCILVDMGGTSFDASLVKGGEAAMYAESEIDRLRIALPMLAITTIGAGGGSVGWIDEGGLLRMGPESAGADPGPACYGRGGSRPACTDANVVLGYLDPTSFAGGEMPLDAEAARSAVQAHVGDALGVDAEQAAAGMYRVINTNMAHGVREITVKRGLDPREFPMVVAGGAGALHACMIALELDMPRLLIPPTASVLCAAGMLRCDLQHDFLRSYVCRFSDLNGAHLQGLVAEMIAEGDALLEAEGIEQEARTHGVLLDLRYLKQYHEVTVPIDRSDLESGDLEAMAAAFHGEHNRLYGYDLAREGTELELINLRVRSMGSTEKPDLPTEALCDADPSAASRGTRRAFVPEADEFADVPVYDGHELRAGNQIAGPALVDRVDTTLFISASFEARMDEFRSLVLTRKEL
ncbi:MAG: hydantoinase/oxoprolinase family protein, partial [Planctomycetota bacterium]|nr:hydantoinase/oxoprolinase family protein [Planctomycetota bacterium]